MCSLAAVRSLVLYGLTAPLQPLKHVFSFLGFLLYVRGRGGFGLLATMARSGSGHPNQLRFEDVPSTTDGDDSKASDSGSGDPGGASTAAVPMDTAPQDAGTTNLPPI